MKLIKSHIIWLILYMENTPKLWDLFDFLIASL